MAIPCNNGLYEVNVTVDFEMTTLFYTGVTDYSVFQITGNNLTFINQGQVIRLFKNGTINSI